MSRKCTTHRRLQKDVQVGSDKLEVVASFCHLGDMLSMAGGCELAKTTHVKNRVKKFQGATACSFITPPLLQDPRSCVQLMCPECDASCKHWSLTSPDLQRLRRNDRVMFRQISNVKPENVAVRLNKLLAGLEIDDLDVILREKGFLMGKRELVALLSLSSWCLVMVERLFIAVPWSCLLFVIVVFSDHTIFVGLDTE